jgi:hypothetical protein
VANKAYSLTFRRQAVALGRVMGAEAASAQLGIGGRETLRRWMEAAGDPPELQGTQAQWRAQFDLAHAQTMSKLASGKLSAVATATIKAIADRNLREPAPPPEPRTPAEEWADDIEAKIRALDPDERHDLSWYLIAMLDEHRRHGDRPDQDCVIPDFDHVTFLEGLGDPEAYMTRRRAEDEAAQAAQLAANRQASQRAQMAALDAETQALVAAAEAWLQVTDAV